MPPPDAEAASIAALMAGESSVTPSPVAPWFRTEKKPSSAAEVETVAINVTSRAVKNGETVMGWGNRAPEAEAAGRGSAITGANPTKG